jgi:hypothetical protein
VDTDIITGVSIIEEVAWKILELNESPVGIVMRNMGSFLDSLHSLLDRCAHLKNNRNEIEYATSYVNSLSALYTELVKRGIKTIPFDSKEMVYKRFVAGVRLFMSIIENISEEELRSKIIPIVSCSNGTIVQDGHCPNGDCSLIIRNTENKP